MPNDIVTLYAGRLHELIEPRQTALNVSDDDLRRELGFESTAPLTLIKRGHMMLPISKVAAVARCLDLPADRLLLQYLTDRMPEVLVALKECRVSAAS